MKERNWVSIDRLALIQGRAAHLTIKLASFSFEYINLIRLIFVQITLENIYTQRSIIFILSLKTDTQLYVSLHFTPSVFVFMLVNQLQF